MRHRFRHSSSILLFAVGALAFSHGHAQTSASDRAERVAVLLPEIDKLYAELASKEHLPGLVYGVVLDGKLVHRIFEKTFFFLC